MINIKHKTIEASNTEAGRNFKQLKWIRMRHCWASLAVAIITLKGRKRFYNNNVSQYHFSLVTLIHKGEAFMRRFDTVQLRTAVRRIWPNGWTLWNICERDWEKLSEIEKEKGKGPKIRFTLPMTNQSRKFALPVVIHCHSYLESRLLW